jgi:hypothetical protein
MSNSAFFNFTQLFLLYFLKETKFQKVVRPTLISVQQKYSSSLDICREELQVFELSLNIQSRDRMTTDGVRIGNGIEFLQIVNTSTVYTLTVLHTSQITIGHTRSSLSLLRSSLAVAW